ncbi:hypothetical protein RYA05_00955 [Pseudomonas syringae pv. actinidiae]|nr:hypothetical protein [Pseudomonas syringae pv. actinidiae]
MLNQKIAFFWRPEEFEIKNEMRTPLSDIEVNVFAQQIAIYTCIETDEIYSEIFPKILKEAKAFNETIKAQCQPH